jgi:hypothetical protein
MILTVPLGTRIGVAFKHLTGEEWRSHLNSESFDSFASRALSLLLRSPFAAPGCLDALALLGNSRGKVRTRERFAALSSMALFRKRPILDTGCRIGECGLGVRIFTDDNEGNEGWAEHRKTSNVRLEPLLLTCAW